MQDQVRANRAKPTIIAEHLKKYDFVLMLDSDAYINDPSITVEEYYASVKLEGNLSIIVPSDCFAEKIGNFGSWNWS